MLPRKHPGLVSLTLVVAIGLFLFTPHQALGIGTGLQMQDPAGEDVTRERFLGAAPAGAWQARHGLTAAQYQAEFTRLTSEGYRLMDVSGYQDGGVVRYAAIWEQLNGSAWQARHGLTPAQYQADFDQLTGQGYRLVRVSGYEDAGPRYAAIWEQANGPAWQARHGLTAAQYQAEFDQQMAQGYRLVDVSGYTVGGQARYAAIWTQASGPAWQARHGLTAAQYQAEFDQLTSQGYRPVRISGYTVGGQARFAAIWTM